MVVGPEDAGVNRLVIKEFEESEKMFAGKKGMKEQAVRQMKTSSILHLWHEKEELCDE